MYMNLRNEKAALPSDLKYVNRIQVLEAVRDSGICCANDISASVSLSRQTVMKAIQFFLNNGILVSAGKGDSTTSGGKRPERYMLSPHKYFLCLTLWPQDLCLHLFTIGKSPVDSLCLSHTPASDPEAAIASIARLVDLMLDKNRISKSDICAVSLSTSGIVDRHNGHLKYNSQAPGWGSDIPLEQYLRAHFPEGTPVFVENAGKMTARPYLLSRDLADKRILVILSGSGLSSCLIEKRHILSGRNSLIGEIGHMIIDPSDTEDCGCGGRGCLERLVSIDRLRQHIDTLRGEYPQSALLHGPVAGLTMPEIFAASTAGDPLANRLVRYIAEHFALALRNISLVFDPDLVVFQGDYAYADGLFDRELRQQLSSFRYYSDGTPFEIKYDRRSLLDLDAEGSYIALANLFFASPELYREPADAEA